MHMMANKREKYNNTTMVSSANRQLEEFNPPLPIGSSQQ